jgi:enterochelin esterase family protein
MTLPRLLLLAALSAFASFATAQPAGSAALVSPEVHADRTVTFRIAAPKASEVTFKGDWHNDPLKMTKAADGVWSLTVGPLPPAIYIYSFTVDGIAMADPVNPRIKLRARTSGSLVEVPAETPSLAEYRDVPHGSVEINWHRATALGGEARTVWVYTPPGYSSEPNRRYPVLYLLHGSNDRPVGWIDVGNIQFIADNLIAEKKAVPMVIVMAYGHALPFGQPATPPRTNTIAFEEYLLRDVMPLAESRYRILTDRAHRAIAGQSMGGEQSLHIFFNNLDRFSSAGAFSPANFRDLENQKAALLTDTAGTNAKIDVLWIGCGRQDSLFAGAEKLSALLTAHQIRHTWFPTDGMHNYAMWRQHMIDFMPRLFQPRP